MTAGPNSDKNLGKALVGAKPDIFLSKPISAAAIHTLVTGQHTGPYARLATAGHKLHFT